MLNRKNLLLNVRGKVQGVFYRASARDTALRIGIAGTVKNCIDGSVEIEAEGSESQLEEFVKWCTTGPPSAIINEIKISEGRIKNFQSFNILRS